jgi:hypothetical protein
VLEHDTQLETKLAAAKEKKAAAEEAASSAASAATAEQDNKVAMALGIHALSAEQLRRAVRRLIEPQLLIAAPGEFQSDAY